MKALASAVMDFSGEEIYKDADENVAHLLLSKTRSKLSQPI
jgi:hypothetical protein